MRVTLMRAIGRLATVCYTLFGEVTGLG
jgi:hypothetical protein